MEHISKPKKNLFYDLSTVCIPWLYVHVSHSLYIYECSLVLASTSILNKHFTLAFMKINEETIDTNK